MIIAINYANKSFAKAQRFNLESAKKFGADKTVAYTPEDIDRDFYEKNREILEAKKGNGYYLWKPYFLNKAFHEELQEGDYLIYTDAGSVFVNKIQFLIDCMEREHLDLMTFSLELGMEEKKYNKRDALILMDCDKPEYTDTPQSIGGYVIMKKTPFVENFLKTDLEYAQDPRIISEIPNTLGLDNYPEFIAHRHDQAVWSLMVKKNGLLRFRDPSQFGMINRYEEEVEKRSTYPQIIDSHRMNVGSMAELKWKRTSIYRFYKKCAQKLVFLTTKNR